MITFVIVLGFIVLGVALIMYLNWHEKKQAKQDRINEINKLPPKGKE